MSFNSFMVQEIYWDRDVRARPTRGGSGGKSYPGLGSPEEMRLSRSVLDQNFFHPCPFCVPDFGQKNGTKFEWRPFFDLFIWTSPNFGGPASIFVPYGKISLWGPAWGVTSLKIGGFFSVQLAYDANVNSNMKLLDQHHKLVEYYKVVILILFNQLVMLITRLRVAVVVCITSWLNRLFWWRFSSGVVILWGFTKLNHYTRWNFI